MDERFLPCAIVVQVHVANQWFDEFIQKFTTLSAHIIAGTSPYVLPIRDAYIFKYSNMAGWTDVADTGRFRSVIFDEVQELRHGEMTQKGQAAKIFANNAAMRIGLSATPIFGYGGEMFNIADVIDPGVLGSKEEFIREWCKADDGKMIIKDAVALGSHLADINLLLREVGKGPPPNRIIIDVPYDNEVAEADEAFARQLAIKVLQGSFHRARTGLARTRHVGAPRHRGRQRPGTSRPTSGSCSKQNAGHPGRLAPRRLRHLAEGIGGVQTGALHGHGTEMRQSRPSRPECPCDLAPAKRP
jgi:hypothetical protein